MRNQDAIAEVLSEVFSDTDSVLELGSGTGQHAVYMSRAFPHLTWQPTDLAECVAGMKCWRDDAGLANVCEPIALDVTMDHWPISIQYDAIFTANTLHYVGWDIAEALLIGAAKALKPNGTFCIYGPFNENGRYTGEGNRQFDGWLKNRDPDSGIRDIETVQKSLSQFDLVLTSRYQMPANNLMLVFKL